MTAQIIPFNKQPSEIDVVNNIKKVMIQYICLNSITEIRDSCVKLGAFDTESAKRIILALMEVEKEVMKL